MPVLGSEKVGKRHTGRLTVTAILNDWRPLQAGDLVYTPVTDHPEFPREFREGKTVYLFRDRETAARIAMAWNSCGGEWTWYVKDFTLLPSESEDPGLQISLF